MRFALWLASAHLLVAGIVLTWAFRSFAAGPIGQVTRIPAGRRWGMAVQGIADWPTNWLAVKLEHVWSLQPLVALATVVLLGTLQWFLVGLVLGLLPRCIKASS